MDFNIELKQKREEAGLSQKEAAKKCAVSLRAWQQWERALAPVVPHLFMQEGCLAELQQYLDAQTPISSEVVMAPDSQPLRIEHSMELQHHYGGSPVLTGETPPEAKDAQNTSNAQSASSPKSKTHFPRIASTPEQVSAILARGITKPFTREDQTKKK